MKKILFITGTRAEYGLMKPILRAIQHDAHLSLSLVVTGMHLSPEFGLSIKEIEKDCFSICARLPLLHTEDTLKGMAKYLGKLIFHLSETVQQEKPDILLSIGDRDEALAGACIGSHLNIPVVHLHGGERTGTLDESMRHAITKMSHVHCCATQQSKKRILKLGEEPWRVHVVGAPGLDMIRKKEFPKKEKIRETFHLNSNKPTLLVIQHPVTTEIESAESQMRETMEAIKSLGHQTIVIYPNADAGGRRMIKVIEGYKHLPFIQCHKTISHSNYLGLLGTVNAIVGNSSSALIETPPFHLPAINIGSRQYLRERSTNVIDVPHHQDKIKKAIEKALFDKKFKSIVKKCKSVYGDGKTAEKVVKILKSVQKDKHTVQKRMTY